MDDREEMSEENKPQGDSDWLKEFNLALQDIVDCDTIGCEFPATHYAKVKCCGAVSICCEDCMEKSLRAVLAMIQTQQRITCKYCHRTNDPQGWVSSPVEI